MPRKTPSSPRSPSSSGERPVTALLLAHSDPPISGQTIIAKSLVEESAGWKRVRLLHINTAYAGKRSDLSGFSPGKVGRMLVYLIRALRTVWREDVSVVVLTPAFLRNPFLKDSLFIFAIHALTRARIVGWVHMEPKRLGLDEAPRWFRTFVSRAVRRVDRWVAAAPALIGKWPGFLPKERCVAIANGIAEPAVSGRPARSGPVRVVYLSAMDSPKGWLDLLGAAQNICRRNPDVEFHFYGDASGDATDDAVKKTFEETGCGRIQWHGGAWGGEKWKALASAGLFCFPSHTEQFPLAVLDAMALGLPIVATDVGAVSDALVPGKGGWLVPPRDPKSLETAIADALCDRDRLSEYGGFNRTRFGEMFTRKAFGDRWRDFLATFPAGRRSETA